MRRHLLDVNVLLALLWPRHQGHAAAQSWFAKSGRRAWATSPLTQLGALRLLTNPAVTRGAIGPAAALDAISRATAHEGHELWPLGGILPGLIPFAGRLQGYRQWSDAALLYQAIEHDGALVTFDAGLKELGEAGRVAVLRY